MSTIETRAYFSADQEKLVEQLKVLRHLVAAVNLYDSPCQLLDSQLNELTVFGEKMTAVAEQLRSTLKRVES